MGSRINATRIDYYPKGLQNILNPLITFFHTSVHVKYFYKICYIKERYTTVFSEYILPIENSCKWQQYKSQQQQLYIVSSVERDNNVTA